MVGQVKQNMDRKLEAASANAGYWNEANATDQSVAGIAPHIAIGRDKQGETIETANQPPPGAATARQVMRHKLRTEAGRTVYMMRKAVVELLYLNVPD